MALAGKTPAEKAGIDLNLGNDKWVDLIKLAVSTPHFTAVENQNLILQSLNSLVLNITALHSIMEA